MLPPEICNLISLFLSTLYTHTESSFKYYNANGHEERWKKAWGLTCNSRPEINVSFASSNWTEEFDEYGYSGLGVVARADDRQGIKYGDIVEYDAKNGTEYAKLIERVSIPPEAAEIIAKLKEAEKMYEDYKNTMHARLKTLVPISFKIDLESFRPHEKKQSSKGTIKKSRVTSRLRNIYRATSYKRDNRPIEYEVATEEEEREIWANMGRCSQDPKF